MADTDDDTQPVPPSTPSLDPQVPAPARRVSVPRQYLIWIVGCAAVLIGLGAATWRLAPVPSGPQNGGPAADASASGQGLLGSAGASRRATPRSPGATVSTASTVSGGIPDTSAGTPQPGAAESPAPTDAATPPDIDPDNDPGTGPITGSENGTAAVSYKVTSRDLLSFTVAVTVTNAGAGTASWHNLTVKLTGINLTVTTSTTAVKHTVVSATDCFTPSAAAASVTAGAPFTFSFTVSGSVLGDIQSAQLDRQTCGPTA